MVSHREGLQIARPDPVEPKVLNVRAREADQILTDVESGVSVILTGVAGIGKTFLSNEVSRRAVDAGRTVLHVRASTGRSRVLFGAVSSSLGIVGPKDLDPTDLVREIDAQFAALSTPSEGSVVLHVDDAHLLDADSAEWVVEIVRSSAAVLLATVNFNSEGTENSGRAASAVFAELWREGIARRVDLARLDESGADRLVESFLSGHHVDVSSRTHIRQRAAGVPLLLRELALEHLDPGLSGPIASRGALTSISMAPRLLDLARGRIESLTTEQREALVLLWKLDGLAEDRAMILLGADNVSTLVRRGHIIRESGMPDGLRAHQLDAETIVALSAPVPGLVTRRVVEAIVDDYLSGADLSPQEAALIAERWTGDDAAALSQVEELYGSRTVSDILVLAAAQANNSRSARVALALARQATRVSPSLRAAVETSKALAAMGRLVPARAVLERSASHRTTKADDLEWVRWSVGLLLRTAPHDLDEFLDEVENWYPDDVDFQAEARMARVMVEFASGRWETGLVAAAEIATDARVNPVERLAAAGFHTSFSVLSGDISGLDLGVGVFAEISPMIEGDSYAAIVRRKAELQAFTWSAVARVGAFIDVTSIVSEIDQRISAALRTGDESHLGLLSAVLGAVRLAQGQYAQADDELRAASARFTGADSYAWRGWVACHRACALAKLGRPEEAREQLVLAAGSVDERSEWDHYAWENARVHVLAAEGSVDTARELALRLARDFAKSPTILVRQLLDAMALGEPAAAVLEGMTDAASRSNLPAVEAAARYASACAGGDVSDVEAAAHHLIELGMIPYADTALRTVERMYLESGARKAAAAAAARRAGLTGRGSAARASASSSVFDASALDLLTTREREVAALVADGLGNRAIAAELFLSVRTVESHVYQALTKLGATSRQHLAALIEVSKTRAG